MKAIKTTRYGGPDVLKMIETDQPVPMENEVLIRIKAIAVTSGDCRMRAFKPPYWYFSIPMRLLLGIFKPRRPIQGLWLSGEVEKAGQAIQKFIVGHKVYARTLDLKFGANAEFICLPENCTIGLKPINLNYEESVAIPFGALTALHFLKKAGIKKSDKVLIYGASGSVGIAAVQLGRYFETEVYAVCSSINIDLVKDNGANYVIDYKEKDITTLNDKFDIVFDAVGKINKSIGKKLLKDKGRFVSVFSSGHAQGGIKELNYITKLAEKEVLKPVIDNIYPFDQIAKAHSHVETGHKKGNVVLKL